MNRLCSVYLCANSVPLWLSLLASHLPQRHGVPRRRTEVFVALTLTIIALTTFPLRAQVAQPIEDPAIEARMRNLTQQLRCPVCQSETVAESQAPLAQDLRREVREQIKAGKSDQEILAYISQRYTDYVLYNPPVKTKTYLLWFGPFLLLVIGCVLLFRFIKQRRAMIEAKPLTAEERRRAEKLLREV